MRCCFCWDLSQKPDIQSSALQDAYPQLQLPVPVAKATLCGVTVFWRLELLNDFSIAKRWNKWRSLIFLYDFMPAPFKNLESWNPRPFSWEQRNSPMVALPEKTSDKLKWLGWWLRDLMPVWSSKNYGTHGSILNSDRCYHVLPQKQTTSEIGEQLPENP